MVMEIGLSARMRGWMVPSEGGEAVAGNRALAGPQGVEGREEEATARAPSPIVGINGPVWVSL